MKEYKEEGMFVLYNQKVASSMLSGSLAQQQKLAIHHQQQNILMHNCNGIGSGGVVGSAGGSTTLSGSDMNSAFYRKVRDERIRLGGCNEELLNPLLPTIEQQQYQMTSGYQQPQQQLFEMPQQQQQFRYWENSGTLNSATAYPQHSFYAPPQSIKSQQVYNNSPHTSTEPPPAEPYQIAHIQERQIKFLDRILGEDSSTQLILGEWIGGMLSGAALQVVLKTLKPNIPQHLAEEQFKEEIQAIGFFEHPNILRLFGVSFLGGRNLFAIFDYMVHGDLIEFLKVREPRNENKNDEQERQRNSEDFLKISTQITCGMAYLSLNGFVHKDLSARNCLVGDQQIIKICNFARMKKQYENDYYKLNSSCRGVPLRWMSKEALNEGRYGQASDVYSFGVCLWEIYTYGKQPYEGCTDEQVIQFVQEGNYLAIPEFCPSAVYAQMVECFNENASRRPNFSELNSKFQKWCQSSQISALHMQQHRASSSVNSGGSGSGITSIGPNNGFGGGGGGGTYLNTNKIIRQGYSSVGNVPSPAPNSSTILAGNFIGDKNKIINSNGNNIVHSTPIIVQNNNNQIKEDKKKGPRPIPMARRRQAFTDEDDLDEDDDYSSEEESNES
uniref:receptor protein-tyrosine kinase n=1 Tax=Meloidogyne hapla TaxID=6305 RepID=A0A1I8BGB2_MELHA